MTLYIHCWVGLSSQRRMTTLTGADRKARVSQITSCYNQGMKRRISEWQSSRTPHRKQLLSPKNRKLKLQWMNHQKKIEKILQAWTALIILRFSQVTFAKTKEEKNLAPFEMHKKSCLTISWLWAFTFLGSCCHFEVPEQPVELKRYLYAGFYGQNYTSSFLPFPVILR